MLHTIFLQFVLLTSFVHLQENVAREADEAYRQGDYAAAIEHYESVLAKGCTSADLHYNLGNAYYRTNQLGLAILHYERALRLNPTMRDARQNLSLAESRTQDRITPLPRLFLLRWVDNLSTHVTPAIWRVVWLLLLLLLGTSVLVMRLASSRRLRKTGLISSLIGILLLFISSVLLLQSTRRFNARNKAVVIPTSVAVKSSPDPQGTDKLILHEGTTLTITDTLSGWYKISIADGTTGWCQKTSVERI